MGKKPGSAHRGVCTIENFESKDRTRRRNGRIDMEVREKSRHVVPPLSVLALDPVDTTSKLPPS